MSLTRIQEMQREAAGEMWKIMHQSGIMTEELYMLEKLAKKHRGTSLWE